MPTRMGAAGHVDSLFDPVDIGVVEFKPGEFNDDFGIAESGDKENSSFLVSLKGEK